MADALSIMMVRSLEKRYRPGMMEWHYEHGLALYASLVASSLHNDESVYPWVYSMYSPLITEDGDIVTYRKGEYNLDQINAGRALFTLYDRSGEERFAKASDLLFEQLETQPRCKCGVYWHKEIYPWQIWLDGVYMEGPFKAEYALRHHDASSLCDIVKQCLIVFKTMRDERTGLLYHGYDESRGMKWSNDITGLSPHFWSRAIGWYLMALIDILDYLPSEQKDRDELVVVIQKLAKSVLDFQSESGMWYQVTDEGGRYGNYLETSASSMFAYSFLKGARLGYLDSSYIAPGLKAVEDIKKRYLTEADDGLHLAGICSVSGLGGNPYRDGSFKYYVSEAKRLDDFKGVGSFILACTESERVLW
ncbi:MAG: glycoside hydrolase family 88 protein [Spirochaetes bacterium]|uniref:Glycoside hydrolase family 88 protein n=1 Tax=Candidatus Ornithospirochaeta stercoripullorum TaxID=2840899 RepID=A0A9D9E0K8_9SPIO|nr:glycoside hydrolase family 88 protein [Candidatus Ornithospirochaeta stercoripullorum]